MFGFSGVAPKVIGVRPFPIRTRHNSSAAARQSPGGFVVSIRTYSVRRETGSIVELCPPPQVEFNHTKNRDVPKNFLVTKKRKGTFLAK
jgi:hypothetical protein